MGEYKTVSIKNVLLSEEDWQAVIRRLSNLDKFVRLREDKIACFSGKSTTKTQYSIDCGGRTTEYGAFLLAVDFYIGSHISGVLIKEMDEKGER